MGRSVKDYISKSINERKAHIDNGDEDFYIVKTSFKTNHEIIRTMSKKFTFDIAEGAHIFKPINIETVSFKRKPYVSASLDLFDIVRNLPKKAYILFKYIINNINYDSNKIVLTTKDIAFIIEDDTQPVISKAINDLIRAKLIEKVNDPMNKNTYAINHNEIFKGNFTDFIYKYRKIYGEYDENRNA